MDPITAALVAAIAAGTTEVGKTAVVDAYNGVKALLTPSTNRHKYEGVIWPGLKGRYISAQGNAWVWKHNEN